MQEGGSCEKNLGRFITIVSYIHFVIKGAQHKGNMTARPRATSTTVHMYDAHGTRLPTSSPGLPVYLLPTRLALYLRFIPGTEWILAHGNKN